MAQVVQIASCLIDIVLIMAIIHFIVDDSFRLKNAKLVLPILVVAFGVLFLFGERYFDTNIVVLVIKVIFPFVVYVIFSKGSWLKRCGKYLLGLLIFSSMEVLSIFIEMLLPVEVFNAAVGTQLDVNSLVVNVVAIIILLYICGQKKMKITFSMKEWGLLLLANGITFMLLTAVGYAKGLPFVNIIPQEFLQIVIKYSVIFLYLFFVISLVNGKVADYFKEVGQITQENMEQQLEYFKAYKNSQEEIRRYKHDMKNHFLYLRTLSKDDKVEEMKEYINSLSKHWESIPQSSSTGNTVVDAIIYGKSFLFKQNNIELTIDGQFVLELKMEPIDICTIFTNAIDNAIEANLKCPSDENKYLKISIKSNLNHYLIVFENPTSIATRITNNHIATDKQEGNHGFGLKNIERALAKYGGTFVIDISATRIFRLEMIIPK